MGIFRYILSILIIGTALQLFGQNSENDTTFIFKDTVDGELETIFIDYNTDSKFYVKVSDFHFKYFDKDSYRYSIDYLKEQKLSLTHSKPIVPWVSWVILKQYKDKYYVYCPCDFWFHFRQSINDTTYIDWTGEGPVANKIIDQKKIDDTTYEFKLTGIYHRDRKVIIHIIDFKKGIAVFEEAIDRLDKKYYLMIAADKITSVPIIVNYCTTQKQMELKFDKVDFKALLAGKQNE